MALLALDAQVITASQRGERFLAISDFFKGPGETALTQGELVTAILLPSASVGFQGRYLRLSRRRGMDLATVGVLVARDRAGGEAGSKGSHRIALAAVAPTPIRVTSAEQVLADYKGEPGAKLEDAFVCLGPADHLDRERETFFLLQVFRINRQLFERDWIGEVGIDRAARESVLELAKQWAGQRKNGATPELVGDMRRTFISDRWEGWEKSPRPSPTRKSAGPRPRREPLRPAPAPRTHRR